jgi:hypothetical protein
MMIMLAQNMALKILSGVSSFSESCRRPFPTPAVTCSILYCFRLVRLVNVDSLTGICVKLGASYKILYSK